MNEPASSSPTRIPVVTNRPPEQRYAHIAMRMKERGDIDWTPEQVAAVEKKIKLVRAMLNEGKPVAPILPTKILEEKDGTVHHYRVLIAAQPHVFVWSQQCRGLISYNGPMAQIQPQTAVAQ